MKRLADIHPEPKKYIAGCPECSCMADYVVAPPTKR